MRFATPLVPARLIRRYKRFLADARLEDGTEVTAHCANPGSMMGLAAPGTRIWLEPNDDPTHKLHFGWRLVDHENGHFTGVDTGLPNRVVKQALQSGGLPGLSGHDAVQAEVRYGRNSRVDFLLAGPGEARTFVEVKSVTLSRTPGLAEFPDSVTARGAKHLHDLSEVVGAGDRAVLLFLVQRTDCSAVTVAADLDPAYAAAMRSAQRAGVQVMALACRIDPTGLAIGAPLPFAMTPT